MNILESIECGTSFPRNTVCILGKDVRGNKLQASQRVKKLDEYVSLPAVHLENTCLEKIDEG